MKTMIVLGLALVLAGCGKVQANSSQVPSSEKGYRHLMKSIKTRSMSTCENLEHDGTTCLRVKGQELCGKTRDEAAEIAATWIDKNIPEGCNGCDSKKE